MSIKINNKTIAGNYGSKPTSYRYVGEIFQSTIPIEDIKVACLDGHKIYSDEGYGSFIQHLISQSLLYPQLVCTEEVWQEKVTQYGSWGQFVINTQENSVRLPKLAGFVQGLNTLEDLAGLLEAGLPNITGSSSNFTKYQGSSTGALRGSGAGYGGGTATSGSDNLRTLEFDASLSNPIYGNSDTVQPQAIQYPYYIVLATGVVQAINVKEDVELNNPYSLFDSKYVETPLYNISWLLANGTYNGSNAVHPSAYQALLVENNAEIAIGSTVTLPIGTEYTKRGLSVKLSTDSDITDYDFVVNTSDETFRLPIKVNLASGKAVVGNGMTLGLTDGTLNAGVSKVGNTYELQPYQNIYGKELGAIGSGNGLGSGAYGITPDPTKSGIETSDSNLYLYFYVGETVQNANLVNVGRIEERLSSFLTRNDKAEIVSWVIPDFDTLITISSLPFIAPYNCYTFVYAERANNNSNTGYLTINGIKLLPFKNVQGYMIGDVTSQIMIKQGDIVNVSGNAHFISGYYCMAKGAK